MQLIAESDHCNADVNARDGSSLYCLLLDCVCRFWARYLRAASPNEGSRSAALQVSSGGGQALAVVTGRVTRGFVVFAAGRFGCAEAVIASSSREGCASVMPRLSRVSARRVSFSCSAARWASTGSRCNSGTLNPWAAATPLRMSTTKLCLRMVISPVDQNCATIMGKVRATF